MTAAAKTRGPWAMPDAVQILPIDVDRPTWLAERRKGLGGSDASTVAGVGWGNTYELYLDKTGRLEEREATKKMEAGTRLEPVLRQWFTDETGIAIRRQGLVRSRIVPIQQVSLDGLTEDGGILETKTTGRWLAEEWEDGQVADHAEIQAQHALAVTGRTHAWVCVLIDGWDFQYRRVERNDGLIDLLTTMEVDFWERYVLADQEPVVTGSALDTLKARFPHVETESVQVLPSDIRPVIAALEESKARRKAAETDVKSHEARIRQLMGDAGIALIGDEPVATLKSIDRAGYTVDPTTYRQLRIVKPKKAGK